MTNTSCRSCGSESIVPIRIRSNLSYVLCKACGYCEILQLSTNAKSMFEKQQARYYGAETPIVSASRSPFDREILVTRGRIVSRYLVERSIVVEVGPGAGTFLRWLINNGHRVVAFEHSPTVARYLSESFSIHVIVGEFESEATGENWADAVCSFHVIEHVADPVRHLARAFEVVRPGGYAFVATPNSCSWEQRLFGNLSPNYDSAHLRIYSRDSLRRLCESVGWTVLEVLTPEYTLAWLRVFSKILRRLRREDEEVTAGKYASSGSAFFRAFAAATIFASAPIRFLQSICSAGNELFFVLKKIG